MTKRRNPTIGRDGRRPFTVRLTESEIDRLKATARATGNTASNVARALLADGAGGVRMAALNGVLIGVLVDLADAPREAGTAIVRLAEAGQGAEAFGLLDALVKRIKARAVSAGRSELEWQACEQAALMQAELIARAGGLTDAQRDQIRTNIEAGDMERLAGDAIFTLKSWDTVDNLVAGGGKLIDLTGLLALREARDKWHEPSAIQAGREGAADRGEAP